MGVNAVEQARSLTLGAVAAPSVTPLRVSMIELDDWRARGNGGIVRARDG